MSTAETFDLLAETLDRRFDAGDRRTVLIMGAGFHHHLRAHLASRTSDPSGDTWKLFTDWNGLLSRIAEDYEIPVLRHEDPAATWESLVIRISTQKRDSKARASGAQSAVHDAEDDALEVLAKRLGDLPFDESHLGGLGRKLLDGYRDVVNLNIDRTLQLAFAAAGATVSEPRKSAAKDALTIPSATWSAGERSGRLWQLHGCASRPKQIVLGTRAYGQSMTRLGTLWDKAKAAERDWPGNPGVGRWTPAEAARWIEARRALTPFDPGNAPLSSLDLFLQSDLVFVGTSLNRAETDLWWALHQRMRNLCRVRVSDRPRTFVLTLRTDGPAPQSQHLMTGPAGIRPVLFESWDELWATVLGRWWV